MRDRLIESRLTPNAISLTGFALCVVAAVLVWQDEYFLGGLAFVDRLRLRHARRPLLADVGQGHAVRRLPGLDARPHRGGRRPDRRRRTSSPTRGDNLAVAAVVVAVLASLMVSYTRARAEALGVECKVGIADRAVRVVILSAGLILAKGAGIVDVELLEPAVYVLAAPVGHHRRAAHLARARRADPPAL